jgi:hypothetical protein
MSGPDSTTFLVTDFRRRAGRENTTGARSSKKEKHALLTKWKEAFAYRVK